MTIQQFFDAYNGLWIESTGISDSGSRDQLSAPVLLLGQLASFNRFPLRAIFTKVNLFVKDLNIRFPLLPIKPNPSYPRSVVGPKFPISKIGSIGTKSKVIPSVIKRVLVNVVNIFSGLGVGNKPLKLNNFSTNSLLGVVSATFESQTPTSPKVSDSFKIGFIHHDVVGSESFTCNCEDPHYFNSLSGVHA